jgi:hypothetical protein
MFECRVSGFLQSTRYIESRFYLSKCTWYIVSRFSVLPGAGYVVSGFSISPGTRYNVYSFSFLLETRHIASAFSLLHVPGTRYIVPELILSLTRYQVHCIWILSLTGYPVYSIWILSLTRAPVYCFCVPSFEVHGDIVFRFCLLPCNRYIVSKGWQRVVNRSFPHPKCYVVFFTYAFRVIQERPVILTSKWQVLGEGAIIICTYLTVLVLTRSKSNSPNDWLIDSLIHSFIGWFIDWFIDWFIHSLIIYGFTSRSKNFSLIWRRHHCRWGAANFRPMLGAQGLWAGRDLYRATPAVTGGLNFSALIRRTAPFSCLLRQARECWGPILTWILTITTMQTCLVWQS